ncbi:MAG: WavE lipopolysaccharide synthesis family protein [Pedobacter sp.]
MEKDKVKENALEKDVVDRVILKEKVLSDISVVIQGKVFGLPGDVYENQQTLQCIESVRSLMPKAEIILSTWDGTDVSHLDFDKLILNEDPGAIAYSIVEPNFFNNNKRQTISTYNGLKAATKTYAVKMRGDCKFSDTDFTDYLMEHPRGEKYRFFKQRIVIPTKYTRNPRRIAQLIHPSDIFQIGLLEDLLDLWDIPLQPEPQTTRAIPIEKKIFNNALDWGHFRMKFGAEQYNWHMLCKKHGLNIELKHYSHIPYDKILASDISIINNFIIDDALILGVLLPKKMHSRPIRDLYTHEEWKELSLKYSKGVSRLYELKLILVVYYSNVSRIVWRIQHRIGKFGFANLFKSMLPYLRPGIRDVRNSQPQVLHANESPGSNLSTIK